MSVEFNRQEWLENNRDKIADLSALRRAGQPTDPLILECARQMTHETPQPKAASWHARFIAEQRAAGQVQPHLLAMLEVLLQEAEREYGGELPKAEIEITEPYCGIPNAGWREMSILWSAASGYVKLELEPDGKMSLIEGTPAIMTRFHWFYSPAQLAAALRELWPKEEA